MLKEIKQKQIDLNHDQFFWLDQPIDDGKRIINRVNMNPYCKDEILPASWYMLKGKTLIEIYHKIKNNNFFIYKYTEDGKSNKIMINENNRP